MVQRLGPQAYHAYIQIRQLVLAARSPEPESGWPLSSSGRLVKLPSQTELAKRCGVALLTVRQALRCLEEEGLVVPIHGKGTFIAPGRAGSPEPETGDPAASQFQAEPGSHATWPATDSALMSSEQHYRDLLETSPNCIALADLNGRIMRLNQVGADLLGYDHPDEVVGVDATSLIVPEDQPRIRQVMRDRVTLRVPRGRATEYRIRRRDGTCVSAEISSSVMLDDTGQPNGLMIVVQDITDRKQAEAALQASEERFRSIFEATAVGINLSDASGRLIQTNRAFQIMLGYTTDELREKSFQDITHPDDLNADLTLYEELVTGRRDSYQLEKRYMRKDGQPVWTRLTVSLLHGHENSAPQDERRHTIAIAEDISDRKRAEEELRHQALHDPLTDLPNRTLLQDRLERAVAGARRTGKPLALLLMDLDHFKEVNDTFGHHYGDLLLKEVSRRLRDVLREADTVARLGGDEFAIVLEGMDASGTPCSIGSTQTVAQKILDAVARPCVVEGNTLDIKTSIGMAFYPEHGEDPETLLRRADVAMYVAKRTESGYAVYDPTEDQYSPERLAILSGLREAIRHDGLVLHYQPKLNLKTGRIDGVEALVRWNHPERGFIPPDQFISLAEETGLIKPLTFWVVDHALRQCRHWHDIGLDLKVAVNLSARNLHDSDMVDVIAELLHRSGADGSWLTVEITESAIMLDAGGAAQALTRLRDLGVTISIDDFGTGYSSFAYLKRLPVDTIKIDRSFVSNMATDEDDGFIVHAIVDMGHKLGLHVVAEGVEDGQTLAVLRALGCDLVQGYHLSPPLPAPSLLEWLQEDRQLVQRALSNLSA